MIFTDNQILELKKLCQDITRNPIPIDKQEAVRSGNDIWCADWWTIEVLKCLFHTESVYRLDPPPNRLKHNKLWSMEQIVTAYTFKMNMLSKLKENKDFSDVLFVCEVGRGIDILLSSFVRQWKRIICYDSNELILNEVNRYFTAQLGLPIETFAMNTGNYDFNQVNDKMVMVGNIIRIGDEQKKIIKGKSNILAIIDGELL